MIPDIHPSRRLEARVDALFKATGRDFVTAPVEEVELTFDGIPGDLHAGVTRRSGSREPWYQRGTVMRNERQVTIVAADELSAAAADMGIDRIEPQWIGANMVVSGVPMLSMLPAATLLFFEGGATIKVDFQNGPCTLSGASIARHLGREGDKELALAFPMHAKRRRGLLGWVEKPGVIAVGAAVRVQLPEQWIYPA